MKQRIQFGEDGWCVLGDYLDEISASSILLVTGARLFQRSGAESALAAVLVGREVHRVCEFASNPRADEVESLLAGLRLKGRFDVILAVGGGSAMDVAKLIKAFWKSESTIVDGLRSGEGVDPATMPLVAIPSTAGSGSESTHFAVVYDGLTKHSVADERLLPELALVVPSMLASVPRWVAAASGMDALCQGIESYWSIHSTEESRRLAKCAVELAWEALESAVERGDAAAQAQMARAANLAGQAINLTKTTAPHAVSYALSALYGIPHGHAVGLLVPEFLLFNVGVTEADVLDGRGVDWVRARIAEICELIGCEDAEAAAVELRGVLFRLGLETDLAVLGICGEADLDAIMSLGPDVERLGNNPRALDARGLRELLRAMWR